MYKLPAIFEFMGVRAVGTQFGRQCRHSAQRYRRNAESKIRSKRRDQGGGKDNG
jgi:hypothetical protein